MRRPLFLLLGLTALIGLAVSSGGFTSVSADRTTEIAVVEDDQAYLGIADELQCGAGNGVGQNKNAVVNRLPGAPINSITIVATIPTSETGELRIGPGGPAEQIGPGESTQFVLDGPFTPGESATIQIKPPTGNVSAAETVVFEKVRASGAGIEVAVDDRDINVNCPPGN